MNDQPSPSPPEPMRLPTDPCIACRVGKVQCDADVWHGDGRCCGYCQHPEWIG